MTYVKCTRMLDISTAQLASYGVVGDREFVLIGEKNEPLNPAQHGPFMSLRFEFSTSKNILTMHYPDGRSVAAPLQVSSQSETFDYIGMRDIRLRKVLGDWDRWLAEYSGQRVRLYRCADRGAGIDVLPITLVTTGSLRLLAEKLGSDVDHRRFRVNLVIENDEPHIEDSWEGAILSIGVAKLRVRSSVPRCLITQMDPDTGRDDLRVVRALHRYRDKVRLPDGLMPKYATPGFASYADVVSPGQIAVGDCVTLSEA